MHILFFHTYEYSFEEWEKTGTFSRELEYFNKIIDNHNFKFTFVSYSDNSEIYYKKYFPNCEIVPVYSLSKKPRNKFIRFLHSIYLPFKLSKNIDFASIDLIKQNQLQGAWVSLILKFLTKKPLYIRTGYDVLTFKRKEKKPIYIKLFYYFLTQFSLMFCNLYSVTSKEDKKFLKKYFIFNKNKIIYLPNFIISQNFEKSKKIKEPIITIGRLEKQKNIDFLLKEFKNSNFHFEHYGEGSELQNLKHLAKVNNVKITFNKMVDNKKILEVLKEHTFFINCSFFEGNPKTVLEALSSGCVVFTSSNKNSLELIKNNENGFIFDLEPDNLRKKFDDIYNDKSLLSTISNNAYLSSKKFSLENIIVEETDYLNKIVKI